MTIFGCGRGGITRVKTAAAPPAYAPNGVVFDGTNDWLSRAGTLTGSANHAALTVAFALRLNATGINQVIFRSNPTTLRMEIKVTTANVLRITIRTTAAATIGDWQSSVTLGTGQWYAVLISRDNSGFDMWIDDTDVTSVNIANVTGDVDLTEGNIGIGARSNGNDKLNGELADLIMWFGTRVDWSTEANRRKIFTAAGALVDKGSDGTTPGFGTPIVFLGDDNDETNWEVNNGTGGDFTVNGALSGSAVDPSGS